MANFQSVLVLAPGGRVAFQGTPESLPAYVATKSPNSEGNPLDVMLHSLADDAAAWTDAWKEREKESPLVQEPPEDTSKGPTMCPTPLDDRTMNFEASFGEQYYQLLRRAARTWIRSPSHAFTTYPNCAELELRFIGGEAKPPRLVRV